MNRIGITLVCIIFWSCFISQDIASLSNEIVQLEQNLHDKAFDKAWKKNRKSWEENCKNAKSTNELIAAFNQLSDVYSSSTGAVHYKMPEIKFTAFCKALIKFKGQLNKEHLNFSENEYSQWDNNINSIIDAENNRIKEEQLKLEEEKKLKNKQIIENMMVDFEKNYLLVLEGAKKGSFQNVRTDIGSKNKYGLSCVFQEASESKIMVDEDDVYQFVLAYSSEDKELSLELEKFIVSIIEKNLPEGFKKGAMFNGSYVSNSTTKYEFEGLKFAETAKRPSISIGVKKDDFQVDFTITEPLFKR